MNNSDISALSPVEFFKNRVEHACERQHVKFTSLASYYLVSLLAEYAEANKRSSQAQDDPLAVTFMRALYSAGRERRRGLKYIGDASLFISGFFSDSLRRKLVDVDYYVSLGSWAYAEMSDNDSCLSEVFAELSEKFVCAVDVFEEISETVCLTRNDDLLRLYEKWARTRSKRLARLLEEYGIAPNANTNLRPQ
jgi:hypothetical protein